MKTILFLLFFSSYSFAGKYYDCLYKDTGRGPYFSVSDISGIRLDHIHFPKRAKGYEHLQKSYVENLTAKTPGGRHNLEITDQFARVNYIQDFVLSFIKTPNGDIVEEDSNAFDKLYRGEYQTLVRLHTIYPVLITYTLHYASSKLIENSSYMEHPRKGTKIYFDTNKRRENGHVYAVKKEQMTDRELKRYFSKYSNKKRIENKVYDCKKMGIIKGNFIHWMKTLIFP